jgi:AcrR family transcriptional regulator
MLTSDAGLLPFRELDHRLGHTEQFARALEDPRYQPFVDHTFLEMVRMRIFGILADYPDLLTGDEPRDAERRRWVHIAREAGISHGLLYHYFQGKEEIFLEIVEQSLQGALWVTSAAREQPGSPWDRMAWLFHSMVRGGRQAPEYVLITIQAATSDAVPDGTRDLMEKYGEPIFHNVVDLIIAGQESGDVVQGDPRKLANAMFSCVQGLVIATVTGSADPGVIPDPEMMLRMLKA